MNKALHPITDSSVVEARFVNELGNQISISIRPTGDQTLIAIIGPSSIGEEQITKGEAAELYEVLGRYMQSIGGAPPQCPKCRSFASKYPGCEDAEVYQCSTCEEVYGYTNPLHT